MFVRSIDSFESGLMEAQKLGVLSALTCFIRKLFAGLHLRKLSQDSISFYYSLLSAPNLAEIAQGVTEMVSPNILLVLGIVPTGFAAAAPSSKPEAAAVHALLATSPPAFETAEVDNLLTKLEDTIATAPSPASETAEGSDASKAVSHAVFKDPPVSSCGVIQLACIVC